MMKFKIFSAVAGAAALFAASGTIASPAQAQRAAPAYGKDAVVTFASRGGIQDWHAVDNRSLYIKDRRGRWYLAQLSAPCPHLNLQPALAFETDILGTFDSFSSISTGSYRCDVERLVTSPPPPTRPGYKHH